VIKDGKIESMEIWRSPLRSGLTGRKLTATRSLSIQSGEEVFDG
jgi:hypothetical protein